MLFPTFIYFIHNATIKCLKALINSVSARHHMDSETLKSYLNNKQIFGIKIHIGTLFQINK